MSNNEFKMVTRTMKAIMGKVILRIAVVLAAALASVAWGNYRWHQGLGAGADTILCIQWSRELGPEAARQKPACKNIAGKKPPLLIVGNPNNVR